MTKSGTNERVPLYPPFGAGLVNLVFDEGCRHIHSAETRHCIWLGEMETDVEGGVGFPLGISSFRLIGFRCRPAREWNGADFMGDG